MDIIADTYELEFEFAECGQGWLDIPCKHEDTIQDCIECVCMHGHARDCGEPVTQELIDRLESND